MATYAPIVPDRQHIAYLFRKSVELHGDRSATRIRAKEAADVSRAHDGWVVQSYRELAGRVVDVAAALIRAGVGRGDRVAVLANNRPEWTQIDLACSTIGAVVVPLYATSTVEQIKHIVTDSGAVFAFAGEQMEVDRFVAATADRGDFGGVISFLPTSYEQVPTLAQFAPVGSATEADRAAVDERLAELSSDDLFSIIYTSGTTGVPRGVMLSHRAMVAEFHALDQHFDFGPEERNLCSLPLSHAFERAWSTYIMSHGCENTYCPNTKAVSELLVEAKPTMMVSVPRLYETVVRTAKSKVAGSAAKQKIFDWALTVGGQMQHAYRKGKQPSAYWRAQFVLADKLVLKAIRDAMGGPKLNLVCGGAPLREDVELFFSAVGLPILVGYGLTEAAPLVTFNSHKEFKVGTAGRVMPGGELRIGEESEIYYRGPNLMDGYWNNPADTAATFTDGTLDNPHPEGAWLKTGDAGYIDTDGFLVITDRLKDIIVTSTGKNVAPQAIEGLLMSDPLFEQAVLLGDNRPFLTLLMKPSMPHLAEIMERLGLPSDRADDYRDDPRVLDEVRQRARKLTDRLPSYEQFKDLRVLFEDFTLENGLLTPTLKVRRREVEERFAQVIDDMYAKLSELRERLPESVQERLGGADTQPSQDEPRSGAVAAEEPAAD